MGGRSPKLSLPVNNDMISEFKLEQNYPNPFNPTTKIKYTIPDDEFVRLAVYNILGEEFALLVSANQISGDYEIEFNASNLPSGIYLYRLQAGKFYKSKSLILQK